MKEQWEYKQRRNRKGGALISALFIAALVAMIATALAIREGLLIHEGELAMHADQGYLSLQKIQAVASSDIYAYTAQWLPGKSAAQGQIKPLKTVISLNGVSGTITFEQGKFNLNNLVYPKNEPYFAALLQAVLPTLSSKAASRLAVSLNNWMTTGADNPDYLKQHPPYVSSKNAMTDITELRLVDGITPAIYTALAPFITALPIKMPQPAASVSSNQPATPTESQAYITQVDVNGAAEPVLMAMNPGLTLSQAQSIVACRQEQGGFFSTGNFMSMCAIPSGVSSLAQITVTGQYFLVTANTVENGVPLSLKSLMVTHVGKNNKLSVITVWQSFE
jgi:general secretion pathway protein K